MCVNAILSFVLLVRTPTRHSNCMDGPLRSDLATDLSSYGLQCAEMTAQLWLGPPRAYAVVLEASFHSS